MTPVCVFRAAVVLFFALWAGVAAAQAPQAGPEDAERVHAAFAKLIEQSETRTHFGLPEDTFWRHRGPLGIALMSDSAQASAASLRQVAAIFSEPTGLDIALVDTGAAPQAGDGLDSIAAEADLVIAVGPRQDLAEVAFAAGFEKGMLARFEIGTLPFVFSFTEGMKRRGVVLLADDEPERAREASFILATVWALGGVTLGPELTGLIDPDPASGPALTPLGKAVFALFFHSELEVGASLSDTLLRARALLTE